MRAAPPLGRSEVAPSGLIDAVGLGGLTRSADKTTPAIAAIP